MSTNKPATVLDLAVHLRPELAKAERITAAEFHALNLPFFGGCFGCGASIAPNNACFGRNGYLVGTCCADIDNAFSLEEAIDERASAIASALAPEIARALAIALEDGEDDG